MGKDNNNFDIDLDFGETFEGRFCELLKTNGSTVEVKTERGRWKETGNLAIELRYYGKPSGLLKTDADWWCHVLADGDAIVGVFMFPVPRLRAMVDAMLNRNEAVKVMGGDDKASEIVLLPINMMYQMSIYSLGKVIR